MSRYKHVLFSVNKKTNICGGVYMLTDWGVVHGSKPYTIILLYIAPLAVVYKIKVIDFVLKTPSS